MWYSLFTGVQSSLSVLHYLQLFNKVTQLHYIEWLSKRYTGTSERAVRCIYCEILDEVLLEKKGSLCCCLKRKDRIKWKERKVMRLLNVEWFMLVLLLQTCLCWENCEQLVSTRSTAGNVADKLEPISSFPDELLLTFFDSKTQWLFPSSSTWFHQRSPTNSLPDTFWRWKKLKGWPNMGTFLINQSKSPFSAAEQAGWCSTCSPSQSRSHMTAGG